MAFSGWPIWLTLTGGVVAFVTVVYAGLTAAVEHRRRQAAVLAAGFVALVAAVPATRPVAAELADWQDWDRNGLLDGYISGEYSWLDIVGAEWVACTAAVWAVSLAFTVIGVKWPGRSGGGT